MGWRQIQDRKEIASFFPSEFNKYFEPFLGSGAIYFAISPQEGLLNDLNKCLINTYEVIRDHPNDLIKWLQKISKEYHSLASIDLKAKPPLKHLTQHKQFHLVHLFAP